ncbi:arginyl-tRNA---protein transferase [Entomortierella parvispora]|uniref:arginyltransferase n=1 Tax=Entomortierella parvispora TaxID=205924 RepID=A0A9P3M1I2_9FUNG|nr:arginyl-tRNA---protein transferase [Entomortierella parvispora]
MSEPFSIVKPTGFSVASCGYCGSENSTHVFGAFAYRLASQDYQDLLDRGWRRFGLYLYKPNVRDSCCKQYTIRLDASKFAPSKGQRRVMGRVIRYIRHQYVPLKISRESITREDTVALEDDGLAAETASDTQRSTRQKSTSPSLGKNESVPTDFLQAIRSSDSDTETGVSVEGWRQFKVKLEPATYSQEKFDLFCEYQKGIHGVAPSMITRESFDKSVTLTPLSIESPKNKLEKRDFQGYGTYHYCFYLDGKLVALAVLDILPRCVSSDYFFYDPTLSSLSLGKYSTLREIALIQELKTIPGYEDIEYYTMGHYVHSASKTHYKAMYHPSYLMDPESFTWTPFERCIYLLQSRQYFSLSLCDLFHPRVKGLMITVTAEKKNREKVLAQASQRRSSSSSESMDVDETDINTLDVKGLSDTGASSSDEDGTKRKRRPHESSPGENTRTGKRPSLTPLPPPGMMDPALVTDKDLSQLVVFQDNKALMLTDTDMFRNDKNVSKLMRDYYAAFGPALAPRMLIYP